MMMLNLRSWMEGGFANLYRKPIERRQRAAARENPELALQLATAEDISATLPGVLEVLQQELDGVFTHSLRGQLMVLLSHGDTNESLLLHPPRFQPSPAFNRRLHRMFTLGKAPQSEVIPCQVDDGEWRLVPQLLMEEKNISAWVIYGFQHELPPREKLRWHTTALENTLRRGISAWYQHEAKTRAALQSERAIYAAELHDSLAQVLGYLRIKSTRLNKVCQNPEYEALQSMTEDLAIQTQNAYRQTRELITSSRLAMQSDNLAQAIVNSITEFEQQSAIVFELDNRIPAKLLDAKESTQVLYIVRESLCNIVRHSHASHARVILRQRQESLQILIEDNGSGIDADAARPDSFGQQIMQERAKRIGGRLTISNRPQGGTRVELSLKPGNAS